jgi:hypothetical protein
MMPIPHTTLDENTDIVEWAKENKHICAQPYTTLQYFFNTAVKPCCNFNLPATTDYFTPIQELKQAIETGQIDKRCNLCHKCEAEGLMSERIRSLNVWDVNQLRNFVTTHKINSDFYVHCTLSGLCNMACRSCNEGNSSLYAKIWTGKDGSTATLSDNDHAWQSLLDNIITAINTKDNVILVVSGGEGLVQPDFFKLIDWLIANDLNKKITLQINTNGSIDKEELFLELTDKFKKVHLSISVDSVYENYYYVRWPVAWDKIHKNLNSFVAYTKTISNFNFGLTPVFSINNIFYLSDWINFFQSFAEEHEIPYIYTLDTPLYHPEWLDIQYMPTYIKQALVEDLSKIVDAPILLSANCVGFRANVLNIIKIANITTNQLNQSSIWKEYLKKTAVWDQLTNAKFAEHNRKLYNLLNSDDRALFNRYKSMQIINEER